MLPKDRADVTNCGKELVSDPSSAGCGLCSRQAVRGLSRKYPAVEYEKPRHIRLRVFGTALVHLG